MKVHLPSTAHLSRAMSRVGAAIQANAPRDIFFTHREESADLVILHVIGYPETEEAIRRLKARGQEYAILQYCLRSTQRRDTKDWRQLWKDASVVWSYYNLYELMEEDEPGSAASNLFSFYHAPLGVESRVFFSCADFPTKRPYLAMTSGFLSESECIHEVAEACKRVGGKHLHLGPDLDFDPKVSSNIHGVTDEELTDYYRATQFVTGLRRLEGFELPAAEGLLCGARPVLFDRPHYRDWYGEWAEYIPEDDSIVSSVVKVFQAGTQPVSDDTRHLAATRFDWPELVKGFWRYVQLGARV